MFAPEKVASLKTFIRISAVAILVAKGMQFISQNRISIWISVSNSRGFKGS